MKKLTKVRKSVIAVLLTGVVMVTTSVKGDTAQVNSLKMERGNGSASYVISKSGATSVEEFMMADPPRLVVDLIGARHEMEQNKWDGDGNFVAGVRTSQFTNDPNEITRLVFDLNGDVSYKIDRADASITVRFFAKGKEDPGQPMSSSVAPMGFTEPAADPKPMPQIELDEPTPRIEAAEQTTQPASAMKEQPQSKPAPSPSPATQTPAPAPMSTTPATTWGAPVSTPDKQATPAQTPKPTPQNPAWNSGPSQSPNITSSPSQPGADAFSSFAAQAGLARNRNITIDVQNADIKTVLRSLSEFSGTNIIAGPDVEGKVTAHLSNVPWRQAMDIVLKAHGFGFREEYGVVRVASLERLMKEELELQAAERKRDELLPLVTRIVPLSYANAEEIRKALKEILTARGSMEVESGQNALVITDIEKNCDRLTAMVTNLDKRTKQVEIVAKMVDVDYEATREMGVRWEALNLTTGDINAVGDAIIDARSSTPAGVFRVGTVQSWGQVQGIIDMLQKDNKANIISNPRIVTADNREANILVGKEIPLIVSDEAGNPITELTKVGIMLRVRPHVNQDHSVTLDLHPEVSELSAQATVQGGVIISLSEADTRVVVQDGETAVIGGLINEVESDLENGVPLLMDLPLVGSLFKLKSSTKKKRELIIFVTPTIVDGVGS